MTSFKSHLGTSVILACAILATQAHAEMEAKMLPDVVMPDRPSITSIQTLIQSKLQDHLQPKTPQKSTVQGECFYVEDKSVGFTQKCKVVMSKRETYSNQQIHTQNRIINIDSPYQGKGEMRYLMNGLDAEQYYLSDGVVVVDTDEVKVNANKGSWTCFKNIVMNVCYRV